MTAMAKPFDILSEFAKFGLQQKLSLREPASAAAFVEHVGLAVERALADPILLQGQRVEAMFEALVISLGNFKLLKNEDGGRLFPAEGFRAPDFRVVLNDGAHWLVEVKNVYEPDPLKQRRKLFSKPYYDTLAAYALATGAELKVAIFWARWQLWTLVSASLLVDDDGLEVDLAMAMRVNELSALGDRMIGTKAPLCLRLTMDSDRTSSIAPDGTVHLTIGRAELFCDGVEVRDALEQEIAWVFMQHGEWRESDDAIVDGDRLVALEYRWEPEERSDDGFDMIGTLSRMFARHYAEHTVADDAIVQLRAPLRPNWFAPLVQPQYVSQALPLWRFSQSPNLDGLARAEAVADAFSA